MNAFRTFLAYLPWPVALAIDTTISLPPYIAKVLVQLAADIVADTRGYAAAHADLRIRTRLTRTR